MAPEILSNRGGYGKAVDMWSLGVVLYVMLYGVYPFFHKSHHTLIKKIVTGYYIYPEKNNVSELAKNIVRRLLTIDPISRITAKECLHHPWMSDMSFF